MRSDHCATRCRLRHSATSQCCRYVPYIPYHTIYQPAVHAYQLRAWLFIHMLAPVEHALNVLALLTLSITFHKTEPCQIHQVSSDKVFLTHFRCICSHLRRESMRRREQPPSSSNQAALQWSTVCSLSAQGTQQRYLFSQKTFGRYRSRHAQT